MDTDWAWLDTSMTPGESLLLIGFMLFLVSTLQWPSIYDWFRKKLGKGK